MTARPPFAEQRPFVALAVEWATERHGDQRRGADGAPFLLHPLEVASLLAGRDLPDGVIAAGVLHDVVEKTSATIEDVRAGFGERVAAIVAAVTEDPLIEDHATQKAALREQAVAAGDDARAVFAADKVAKARELRAEAARDPSALQRPDLRLRLEHYERSLGALRAAEAATPFLAQLDFELWALHTFPPAPRHDDVTATHRP